jgi:TATA-box binding protein (TBP) (component of TFIID and TFIIIB)
MFEGIRTVNSTVTIFLGRKLQKEEFLCIARSGVNSVYNPRKFHAIIFQFHTTPKKHITALLFESGKVIFTGGKNETESKKAIRKLVTICNWAFSKAKIPRVCINDVNVRNVVFAGKMPKRMHIEKAFRHFREPTNAQNFTIKRCRYDPSIFPGLRIATATGFTLLIFVSGNFIVTGLKSYENCNQNVTNLLEFLCSKFTMDE